MYLYLITKIKQYYNSDYSKVVDATFDVSVLKEYDANEYYFFKLPIFVDEVSKLKNADLKTYFQKKPIYINLNYYYKTADFEKSIVRDYNSLEDLEELFKEVEKVELEIPEEIDEDYIISLFIDYDVNSKELVIQNDKVLNYVNFLIYCYEKEINEANSKSFEENMLLDLKKDFLAKMKREVLKYQIYSGDNNSKKL